MFPNDAFDSDTKTASARTTTTQVHYVVPQVTVKELLAEIPPHCMERSLLRSSGYLVWDSVIIYSLYRLATAVDEWIFLRIGWFELGHPYLHALTRVMLWGAYSFGAGLFGFGLWVIAHECGHQAFSQYKELNHLVGLVIHTILGVPYHGWRITHAKHHAHTSHLLEDEAYVPMTRSSLNLPPLDRTHEDEYGASVTEKIKTELVEALGDSPIGAAIGTAQYLIWGLLYYFIFNASGQARYPRFTNHYLPGRPLFAPHQFWQIILSDVALLIWAAILVFWSMQRGASEMVRVYLLPYLWVNHWVVLVTFLHHTDPLLPHYRSDAWTFPRGALSTLDRSLLGGGGTFWGYIGACASHGISETHVLHHLCSRIPHYNAWEASDALKKRLRDVGIESDGRPGGWSEMYRVFRECQFIEDTGSVVFYKNAQGLAAARPIWPNAALPKTQ